MTYLLNLPPILDKSQDNLSTHFNKFITFYLFPIINIIPKSMKIYN